VSEDSSVDELLEKLRELAASPYPEIVVDAEIAYRKLRTYLIDESLIEDGFREGCPIDVSKLKLLHRI